MAAMPSRRCDVLMTGEGNAKKDDAGKKRDDRMVSLV